MSVVSESETELRQRCYQCFRPQALCFCDSIPQIDNRTNVLLLQHARERFHPFNTARIVQAALRRCDLVVDYKQQLAASPLPIEPCAGLLYPSADATALLELSVAERPSQLVIIDGTWHQAKTIFRDVAQLRDLPRYRLSPEAAGQFRIRREPNAQSLSTVEATVAALQALEPETAGLDQLLAAFHTMIETQLAHSASRAAWRKNRKRESRPRNIPDALLQDPDRLVVAYGEATPGRAGHRTTSPTAVNWVAQRIGTAERFSCLLEQHSPLSDDSLQHMRLSAADFDAAVSPDEFFRRWNHFLQPGDVLIVYHQRTSQLLQNMGVRLPQGLVLKSIFGRWQTGFHSQEELLGLEGLLFSVCEGTSRANQRLAMSTALVEHLRTRYANLC